MRETHIIMHINKNAHRIAHQRCWNNIQRSLKVVWSETIWSRTQDNLSPWSRHVDRFVISALNAVSERTLKGTEIKFGDLWSHLLGWDGVVDFAPAPSQFWYHAEIGRCRSNFLSDRRGPRNVWLMGWWDLVDYVKSFRHLVWSLCEIWWLEVTQKFGSWDSESQPLKGTQMTQGYRKCWRGSIKYIMTSS